MFNKSLLISATLISSLAFGQAEISGKITHESASFTEAGTSQGSSTSHGTDTFKEETSLRLYIDGEIDALNNGAYHLELQGFNDGKAINSFSSGEAYTQRDPLREAYVDATFGDNDEIMTRTGKQQVVWGKADGMKLLDIVNPTDYSEMAQNQMEDSRIPVFMVNVEKVLDEGGTLQLVVSQPRENYFPGLNRDISTAKRTNGAVTGEYTYVTKSATTDTTNANLFSSYAADTVTYSHDNGQAFVLKGVDTITGEKNGFLNIVPDVGTVAALFGRAFNIQGSTTEGGLSANLHGNMQSGFTVGGFNTTTTLGSFSETFRTNTQVIADNDADALVDVSGTNISSVGYGFEKTNLGLTSFWRVSDVSGTYVSATTTETAGGGALYSGATTLGGFAAKFNTNLNKDADNTNFGVPTAAVDSVFEIMDRTSFTTFDTFVNATSEYKYDMPSDTDVNLGLRVNNTTKDGLNYSLVYSYNYDQNPVINVGWVNSAGTSVDLTRSSTFATQSDNGEGYSAYLTASGYGGYAGDYLTLRFTETLKRAHNIGGAFDYAFETDALGPVVLRAEGLYQKDVYSPVIDRGKIAIGDLAGGLKMIPGDKFKYVLGLDMTALTNMMISTQFIQERNLDYVDNNVDFDGAACTAARTGRMHAENCGVYTADFASMHLTNGMKKALKNKEYYSLFLSKPFGSSDQHRFNNIYMIEEGGGRWNRLDAEFTITDNVVATGEWNRYWGNDDTQFGQLKDSSNVQLGVKYSF
jgi:hypothetical protein